MIKSTGSSSAFLIYAFKQSFGYELYGYYIDYKFITDTSFDYG